MSKEQSANEVVGEQCPVGQRMALSCAYGTSLALVINTVANDLPEETKLRLVQWSYPVFLEMYARGMVELKGVPADEEEWASDAVASAAAGVAKRLSDNGKIGKL